MLFVNYHGAVMLETQSCFVVEGLPHLVAMKYICIACIYTVHNVNNLVIVTLMPLDNKYIVTVALEVGFYYIRNHTRIFDSPLTLVCPITFQYSLALL